MKNVANWMAAIALSLAFGLSHAGDISLRSDSEACDTKIPQDKAALVQAYRTGKTVVLEVIAQFNCATRPAQPALREWADAATVSVQSHSESGMYTACLCARKVAFDITSLYEGVQTIYYLQDGSVLGHVAAP